MDGMMQRRGETRTRALALVGIVAAVIALIAALWTSGAIFAQEQQPGAEQQSDQELGLLVAGTDPDGPAAKAGVVRGDILLSIEGKATNTYQELFEALEGRHAGD